MQEEAGFKDFTVQTAFERLVASIEACVVTWSARKDAPITLQAQLQHRLPWRAEPYTLTLHLPPPPPLGAAAAASDGDALADGAALRDAPHRLQHWFGARAFLLLTPDSYSGRVLEEEEAHTLLSAGAVALSHARCGWALLLPVHDAVRDAYRGVAVACPAAGGATLHFDTDSLHSSRLSPSLLRLDQQLRLFGRQLGAAGARGAAAACRAAAGAELDAELAPASMAAHAAWAPDDRQSGEGRHVELAVRHSYALPDPADRQDGGSSGGWAEEAEGGRHAEWDEQAPWRPWAAQADPVGCLELDVVWHFPDAAAAVQHHAGSEPGGEAAAAEAAAAAAAAEGGGGGLAPEDAAVWRLLALEPGYERDTGHRGFVLRAVDKPRRFLRLQSLEGPQAGAILSGSAGVEPGALPGESSFYGMLLKVLESCRWAAKAGDLGSLASEAWWQRQGKGKAVPPLAPDWVLQEATRDVFQMAVLPVWPAFPPGTVAWPTTTAGQLGCLGKAAPLGALISRFALHALALGSPRSVAELWSRFVSTLRLQFWEPLQPLPRMRLGERQAGQGKQSHQQQQQAAADGGQQEQQQHASAGTAGAASQGSEEGRPEAPNLELCLLHQKLQLLDLCIHMLREQGQQPGQQRQQRPGEGKAAAGKPAVANGPAPAADGWEWDSSEGEGDKQQGEGQQQASKGPAQPPPSPSSSSSSYFSAAASDANLSPARSQQALSRQPSEAAVAGAGEAQSPPAPDGAQPTPAASPAAGEAAGAGEAASPPAGQQAEEAAGQGAGPAAAAAASDKPPGADYALPGATLHLHPDRPLWVPLVQEPPVQTEDVLAEQAGAQALPVSPGQDASALRTQLQGRMLVSDMQAFKAANPGCCLLDFVRWHSPKDAVQGADGSWRLSVRMASEGNAWQQLWAAAAPMPAAQQRPLLDPQLEGERALHFLETLPPPALFAELLAVGYSAAVQLLGATGPATELPAVRRQLGCLAAAAGPPLLNGVAAVTLPAADDAGGSAAAAEAGKEAGAAGGVEQGAASEDAAEVWEEDEGWEEEEEGWEEEEETEADAKVEARPVANGFAPPADWQQRQPSWLQHVYAHGLNSAAFSHVLLLLGCAEQTAVAAHSLLLRLGWQRVGAGAGEGGQFAPAVANALVATALGAAAGQQQLEASQQGQQRGGILTSAAQAPASLAVLPPADWPTAQALLLQRPADEVASESASSASGSEGGAGPAEWPAPFQREWLLQVKAGPAAGGATAAQGQAAAGGAAAEAGAACQSSSPVLQRMYVKALPSEVRIATVVSAETCSQA